MQSSTITHIFTFLEQIDDYYHSFIEESIDFLDNSLPKNILQEAVLEQLITILNSEVNKSLDGIRYYWFQHLQDLLYIAELTNELNSCSTEKVFQELKQDILGFWFNLKFGIPLNADLEDNFEKSNNDLLGLLEHQLLSFFHLHINSEIPLPFAALYFPIEQLGENEQRLGVEYPYYISIKDIQLPLIIEQKSDTTLYLKENTIEELPINDSKQYYIIDSTPISSPLNKFILGICHCNNPDINSPLLNCTREDIPSAISKYVVNLFDTLANDEPLNEAEFNRLEKEWQIANNPT